MRVGFLSKFDRERIAFMKQYGFGSVELLVEPDANFLPGMDGWKSKASQIRSAYADVDIRVSCIGGFYANHMDADPGVARRRFEHVRNIIALAEAIGVSTVAGFPGRIVNEPLENSIPRFRELWSEHAKFAADHGVRIAFEHCPLGASHTPFGGINCMCTPAMWEKCFDAVPADNLGLEWDASHLICLMIDPIVNIRRYGRKVFHVHAKDAKVYADTLSRYGLFHPGAIEHCFPGLGATDWGLAVKELMRAGYSGDLNIEGWHDEALRNHENGPQLEDLGLRIALRHLSQFVDGV